ncbi:response regulator [Candidatus Saccharibacteria bacterium]|nr:response regulator [Candidatus Saccharibacteria bacterium]
MIYIVDDDIVMAKCIARACGEREVRIFGNAIETMEAISSGELPDLMFLDILLIGPDGFTLLNEMVSYTDTARVPVVLVTSLEMAERDLSNYGVVGVLEKETMKPEDVKRYAWQFA